MSGPKHYRVWEDGAKEDLPTDQTFMIFPSDCSPEERQRTEDEYYAHSRAVLEPVTERRFF